MSIESIFISFIYPGQSPVRLGGSRCTLSKALGPSYFPSIRAGCIPRSRISFKAGRFGPRDLQMFVF